MLSVKVKAADTIF